MVHTNGRGSLHAVLPSGMLAQADSMMRTAIAQARRIVFSRVVANNSRSKRNIPPRAAHAEQACATLKGAASSAAASSAAALKSTELHHLPRNRDGVFVALHSNVFIGAMDRARLAGVDQHALETVLVVRQVNVMAGIGGRDQQ
jgi:hypothetical protein